MGNLTNLANLLGLGNNRNAAGGWIAPPASAPAQHPVSYISAPEGLLGKVQAKYQHYTPEWAQSLLSNLLKVGSVMGLNDPGAAFGGPGASLRAAAPILGKGLKATQPLSSLVKAEAAAGSWRDKIAAPLKPVQLGEVLDSAQDLTRGWITSDGKVVQVAESHQNSLQNAFGIPYEAAQNSYPEIANEKGMLRVMTRRTNQGHGPLAPFAELFGEPSDAQLRQLREIEKTTGKPLEFAFTEPVTNKLISRGEGVNQIRGTWDNLSAPVDLKRLGTKTSAEELRAGWLLDDGTLVNKSGKDTHAQSLMRALKTAPDDLYAATKKMPEYAGKQGLVRIGVERMGDKQIPYVEFFSRPTDSQLRALRELEKVYGNPISFDLASPRVASLAGTGTGVNSVRRTMADSEAKFGKLWPEE